MTKPVPNSHDPAQWAANIRSLSCETRCCRNPATYTVRLSGNAIGCYCGPCTDALCAYLPGRTLVFTPLRRAMVGDNRAQTPLRERPA